MYKKRSSIDIVAKILSLAENDIRKTQLLYQANMNYFNLNKYLRILIETELIICQNKHYKTTEKGKQVLSHCREFRELLPAILPPSI